MPKSPEEVVEIWRDRESGYGPVVSRMRELRNVYNSDIVLPGPEIAETDRPAVANLVQQGLDQIAMRVASTLPQVQFPPLKAGIKVSEEKANRRRLTIGGWWEATSMGRKLRKRARWLIGYAQAPVVVGPDLKNQIPKWDLRDPLSCYPAPGLDEGEIAPPDCLFAYNRSKEWLRANYPDELAKIAKSKRDSKFTILEYHDDEETVLVVVGGTPDATLPETQGSASEVLVRIPNRIGMCPVVVPRRVSLDRPLGQFDGAIGHYLTQAALMSLNILAVKRGVFAETWAVYPPDRRGQIITPADAEEGQIGEIQGADLKTVQPQPGVYTNQTLDRLEGYERGTAGIPSEMTGGFASSNIRTGKRGGQVMSAAVDFHVQEAQELFEESLHEENVRAIAIAKEYWGTKSKSIYITQAPGSVEYTPNKDFETDAHNVEYAYAGMDISQLNVETLQLVGAGALSKQRMMEIHPLIKDVEAEKDRVVGEALEQALLGSVQAQAQNPDGPYQPIDMANLIKLVTTDKKELAEAIAQVHEDAQKMQAQQQQAPPEAGAPEAQPGLSQPGAPGTPGAAPPSIPPEEPSVQNLRFRLQDLNSIARQGGNSAPRRA